MRKNKVDEIITKDTIDYCGKCGCLKDICCGQGKISLERLEQLVNENHFRSVKDLFLVAKKEAGK